MEHLAQNSNQNPYTFATWWCKPLSFQTLLMCTIISLERDDSFLSRFAWYYLQLILAADRSVHSFKLTVVYCACMINARVHNLKCQRSTSVCKDIEIEFDAIVFRFFKIYLRQPCCWLKHGWSISLYLKLIQMRKNMKPSMKGHIHSNLYLIFIYIQDHARCKILQIPIQVFI